MSPSTCPKIAVARIPNITALRNELDYGDPNLPRCAAFYDDTRAFRKKFRTSHGRAGVDLHDWKSPEGQADLTEMTVAYLDKEGNGRLFWPDGRASPNYNRFQYAKDSARINRLVKQLFFRLNQQQFRNVKYKHKDDQESRATERGHSAQTAIDVDSIVISPFGSHNPWQSNAPLLFNEPPREWDLSAAADGLFVDPGLQPDEDHPGQNCIVLSLTDVYDGPQSNAPSPPMRQFEAVNRPSTAKRGISSAETSAQNRQPKRAKRQTKPSYVILDSELPATNLEADKTWKSARVRRLVRREGFADLAEIDRSLGLGMAASGREPHEASSPQHTSFPEAQKIILTKPDDTPSGPAHRDVSTDRSHPLQQPLSPAALGRTVSPSLSREIESAQHTNNPLDGAKTPITSSSVGESGGCLRNTGQPKPLLHESSTSSTLATAEEPGGKEPGSSGGGASNPPVKFIYRVVLTRTPRTIAERWNPQGRFQDKTLVELFKELPFDKGESKGLMFTIESPCMKTVERILYSDEDSFASMKRYINLEIREWFARQRRLGSSKLQPRLVIDIRIERMTSDGDSRHGNEEDEDLDLEW